MILYPFIKGKNDYEVDMSDSHWKDLGGALKRVHNLTLPPALAKIVNREDFTPRWREMVKHFPSGSGDNQVGDPLAEKLMDFLKARRAEILDLLSRADRLAVGLQSRPQEFVLCHSDAHAGNFLIEPKGRLYLVDWDQPILAPKERDLMFAGGAQGFTGHILLEQEALFYEGYGSTEVDPAALAYYRYERIVQDIAAFCEEILSSPEKSQDRSKPSAI